MSFGHAGNHRRGGRGHRDPRRSHAWKRAGSAWSSGSTRSPDAVKEKLGAPALMAEQLSKVFIDVEVDASAASDPELAAKLEEVCPVDIFKGTDSGVEIVEAEPRRGACSASSASKSRGPRAPSTCASSTTAPSCASSGAATTRRGTAPRSGRHRPPRRRFSRCSSAPPGPSGRWRPRAGPWRSR